MNSSFKVQKMQFESSLANLNNVIENSIDKHLYSKESVLNVQSTLEYYPQIKTSDRELSGYVTCKLKFNKSSNCRDEEFYFTLRKCEAESPYFQLSEESWMSNSQKNFYKNVAAELNKTIKKIY